MPKLKKPRKVGKRRTKLVPFSARRRHNAKRPPSSFELAIYAVLEEAGIPFTREKRIGRCTVDLFLEPNIVIECQGCWWHRCSCLMPEEGWSKADKAVLVKDSRRFSFLQTRSMDVFLIWECEWKNSPDSVRALLRSLGERANSDRPGSPPESPRSTAKRPARATKTSGGKHS